MFAADAQIVPLPRRAIGAQREDSPFKSALDGLLAASFFLVRIQSEQVGPAETIRL
jgi:hypothetical protein